MIPLALRGASEADAPFVVRTRVRHERSMPGDAVLVEDGPEGAVFSGRHGLFEVGFGADELDGDVLLVDPGRGRVNRLLRAGASSHNTLLVTERCDQLCVMCSQPPKKRHDDRFDLLEEACLLADPGATISVSGGEPTLYKERLLLMLERVLLDRPDLSFHVLSNGQHFERSDVERLRDPRFRKVTWGIPLYAHDPGVHDAIVGKEGAFDRLHESFASLILAGAAVELRTVVVTDNVHELPELARHVSAFLGFIRVWSVMQLESVGFARRRWAHLRVDHAADFGPIGAALDHALLHGIAARLFNFPLCSVPVVYRAHAVASISDWKRKYAPACAGCRAKEGCTGFFEWHPDEEARATAKPV